MNVEKLIDALKWILRDGFYNDDGDFVLRHGEWDGESDPPDTSDPPAITNAVELLESL